MSLQSFSISALCALALSVNLTASTQLLQKEINNISFLKKQNFKVSKVNDLGDLYQLRVKSPKQSFDGYLTKDKKYFLFGTVFDTQTGEKLFISTDMKQYNDREAFVYGEGKDEYYVFTDPQCPYCSKFEKQWKKLSKYAKFHTFLFPLGFHKDAREMSLFILNKKNDKERAEALFTLANDKNAKFDTKDISLEDKKLLIEKLNKNIDVAKELSITGTPTLFDKNGQKVQWNTLLDKYKIKSIDMKSIDVLIKQKSYIKFGDGKKKLYLFTDVDCPFCQKEFTSGKLEALAKEHTIYVFLHPLAKIHPKSFAKSFFILNQKSEEDKLKQLKRFLSGSELTKEELEETSKVAKSKTNTSDALKSLTIIEYMTMKSNIRSTPSMYDEKGNKI